MSAKQLPVNYHQYGDKLKVEFGELDATDGEQLWRIAQETQELRSISAYSYILWCRDFADTSVMARDGDACCGFAIGYVRPARSDTFFVWQVAVDRAHRGQDVDRRMLDALGDQLGARGHRFMETAVTPSNTADIELFESFARDRGCELVRSHLFGAEHSPKKGWESALLFRIGPLKPGR